MTVIQEFIDRLKTGDFFIPVCKSCGKRAWPPATFCPVCLSQTTLKRIDRIGVVVEFASSHLKNIEGVFGVIDIDGIRLVGAIKAHKISLGMPVKLVTCGLNEEGSPYYDFEPFEAGP